MGNEIGASPGKPFALSVGGELKATSGEEDGQKRIQTHIGSVLRLNSLVVLVGAGASFHLNGPRIRTSDTDSIRALLRDVGEDLTDTDTAFIATVCPDAPFNLEGLLERLNATLAFAESTRALVVPIGAIAGMSVAHLKELRRKINASLVAACDLGRDEEVPQPWAIHQAFFRKLLSVRRDLPFTRVFTTNYDLAIENALDSAGTDYIDGFKGTVTRSFSPEVYDQVLYSGPSADQRRMLPVPSLLYVYKLHGSINWRIRGEDDDQRVVQVPAETSPTLGDLALIYPTQDKESSALGFPYADLMRAFSDSILSPEVGLLTIGYGFADAHINRIIDRALASNYTLQVVLVDPNSIGTILPTDDGRIAEIAFQDTPSARYARRQDARIAALLGPGATFGQFSSHVMPDLDIDDVLTPRPGQRP